MTVAGFISIVISEPSEIENVVLTALSIARAARSKKRRCPATKIDRIDVSSHLR